MQGHRLPERLHRPVGVPVPLHVGAEHLEGVGQLAQDGVALFPQELDGFPCRARGRLRSVGAGQAPGEGSQRCGEARTEDLGALRCQLAVEGDGFPCHPETCPGVARLVEVTGETVQGRGQLRTELGPPGGEYAEAAARLLAGVDRPGAVAQAARWWPSAWRAAASRGRKASGSSSASPRRSPTASSACGTAATASPASASRAA